MAVEFDGERDVPLLGIIGAGVGLALYGIAPLIYYTPLYTLPRYVVWAAIFVPLCIGPLTYWWGYSRDRLRVAYPVVLVVLTVSFGTLFWFKSNGAGDTSDPTIHEVEVLGKSYWTAPRGARNFYFVVTFPEFAPEKQTRVGAGKPLWAETEVGEIVEVEVYPGARGIAWVDRVRAPGGLGEGVGLACSLPGRRGVVGQP
jgi:hypothetical protein